MADKEDVNLEVEPEKTSETQNAVVGKSSSSLGDSHWHRYKTWYTSHKKLTIPASILVLILFLASVPWTRYNLAGSIIKKDFTVQVLDSETNTPVSGADVSMEQKTVETDSSGKATLKGVKVGSHSMLVHKKYYSDVMTNSLVPILNQKNPVLIKFQATGRQAQVTIKNTISRTPVANATIKVAGISAKTDSKGQATLVLPTGVASQKASISADGYNVASATIKVSNTTVENNQFTITPAGKVYFLSKLSGKIDVVKANLDGADRQTVLAGTGNEDDQNTVLLASRDWKFLALLSRRAGNFATLYLIDTSDDSLSTIDEGTANFDLLGWSDHYFSYVIDRQNIQPWQPKAQTIKSFNAQNRQYLSLDSTSATGSSNADAKYETYIIKPILLDSLIVYAKTWYAYPGYLNVSGQSNTLNVIRPDGSGVKQLKSLDATKAYFGTMIFHTPSSVYVQTSNLDTSPGTFYEVNGSGVLSQKDNLVADDLFKTYPTYLFSPSNNETFWAEPRDGKNTLFIGDQDGLNPKQIATLSDYFTYGWFSDNYLLVSKNGSELYIMSRDGSQPVVKISDYHKPAQSYYGYGGGYGGI